MITQPGRVEYSYPLKGDQERSKSVKALQQLTVDLLALHNMYKESHSTPLTLFVDFAKEVLMRLRLMAQVMLCHK